jgi:hypothetical protein
MPCLSPTEMLPFQHGAVGVTRKARLVEASMSMTRAFVSSTSIGCVFPRMNRWVTSKCRLLHPAEALRLQAINVPSNLLQNMSDATLADLAGNAFHGGCAMAAFFVQFVVCGIGLQRRSGMIPPTVGAPGPDEGELSELDFEGFLQ